MKNAVIMMSIPTRRNEKRMEFVSPVKEAPRVKIPKKDENLSLICYGIYNLYKIADSLPCKVENLVTEVDGEGSITSLQFTIDDNLMMWLSGLGWITSNKIYGVDEDIHIRDFESLIGDKRRKLYKALVKFA